MSFLVLCEVGGGLERLAALAALVVLLVLDPLRHVALLVLEHVVLLRELLAAHLASVRLHSRVPPECFGCRMFLANFLQVFKIACSRVLLALCRFV